MQLILAIDADRRRADQLAGLVSRRLAVELVQATSAGEALQALGDRVPDLILTSPLLSPFDEGVLAEYLREIGTAGAHVQTLRIPVLGVAKPEGRSLFSFGRKRKADSAPDGCDPSFFVDEIAGYLARAADERQAAKASSPPALDVTAHAESRDVPLTYVPAYEPEPYASQNVAANGPEDEWHYETPIYTPEAAAPPSDQIVDMESAPVGDEGTIGNGEPEPSLDAGEFLGQSRGEALVVHPQEVVTARATEHNIEEQEAVGSVDDPHRVMAASVDAGDDLSSPGSTPISVEESGDTITIAAEIEPAVVHKAVVDEDDVVTPTATESSAAPLATRQEPEPDHAVTTQAAAAPPPRRSAGFEAALAAIRNAWGVKRRTEPAPASMLVGATGFRQTPSPADSAQPAATEAQGLVAPSAGIVEATEDDDAELESSGAESNGPLEIDLTNDVEALDDPVPIETGAQHTEQDSATADEDVYELSAAALPDLESDLAAAAPPRVVPHVLPEMEDEETPRAKARRGTAKDESRKSRTRSDKRPPAEPRKANTRPAQDEWGMFDPNRCGFAAVVQKLNEVTDEEEQKGSKTTVRLISFR